MRGSPSTTPHVSHSVERSTKGLLGLMADCAWAKRHNRSEITIGSSNGRVVGMRRIRL
jgi:hypothetical protein